MNEISDDMGRAPETLDMGGAPPHTDTRIRPAACGRVQIGLFKTTRQCAKHFSLALTPTLHRFPCKDDLEASPLD